MQTLRVDFLLLSIIRAYDHPDRKSEQERLAVARDALFGEKRGRGRTSARDEVALFKMLNEMRKLELDRLGRAIARSFPETQTPEGKAELERDQMTVRESAREFSKYVGTNVSDESVEDRLRRKVRAQLSPREISTLSTAMNPDHDLTRSAIQILEMFESLGVKSDSIWDENA